MPRAALGWSALFMFWCASASATVGGPCDTEVLGFEPVDGKIYVLKGCHDESGELPRLGWIGLNQQEEAPRVRWVRSWYQGASLEEVERAFPERLAKLKARLKPLQRAPVEGVELTLGWRDHRVCADAPPLTRTSAQIKAILARHARGEGYDPDHPVCLSQSARLRWGGYAKTTYLESWGSGAVRLTGLWRLPDARFTLARIRYIGRHYETGYEVDQLLMMPRVAPAPAPEPTAVDPRCARWTIEAPSVSDPQLIKPGAWLPALAPALVDRGPWRSSHGRRVTLDGVDYSAMVIQRDLSATLAIGRAVEGGVCVIAALLDDFGGNGAVVRLTQAQIKDARALLVFRHDHTYRGGDEERAWSVFKIGPEGGAWWLEERRLDAERLVVLGDQLSAVKGREARRVKHTPRGATARP